MLFLLKISHHIEKGDSQHRDRSIHVYTTISMTVKHTPVGYRRIEQCLFTRAIFVLGIFADAISSWMFLFVTYNLIDLWLIHEKANL